MMTLLLIAAISFILLRRGHTLLVRLTRRRLPKAFTAERVFVIDGDTVWVEGNRIRLYGIDAPERDQPYGSDARSALAGLVNGYRIRFEPVTFDVYGRLVARLVREDGTDICSAMVISGNALATSKYTRRYDRAQAQARSTRAGFWATGGIQDPAAWRAAHAR